MTTTEKIVRTAETRPWIACVIILAGPAALFPFSGPSPAGGMLWMAGSALWFISCSAAFAWLSRRADQALWARKVADNAAAEQRRSEAARQAQWPSVTRILALMVAGSPALS